MILSIISGTYNRLKHLKDFVVSCRASLPPSFVPGEDYEIVLADGGSTDGTLEWCRAQPDIVLLEQGKLLGAIAAFNAAGAAARGDYLFIGNDDVTVVGKSLSKGLAYIMDNPDVGAVAFYQDRGGKPWHVERMPIFKDGEQGFLPYIQTGIMPRWLWDKCEGWGTWGGRTYGGDNYLSGRIYESGYKIVDREDCQIHDGTADDELRRLNNQNCKDGELLWKAYPRFEIPDGPIYPNPLPERQRILYAPIIESGHTQAKLQKKGLREALKTKGVVWEVDYIYSGESVVEAAEVWKPHVVITQFHSAANCTMEDAKRLRDACSGPMVNWSGDVWNDQSSPEMLELLRNFDYHLTVNASLLPTYAEKGIKAAYWQNSAEPLTYSHPGTGNPAKPHDVVFQGNEYSEYRTGLGKMLKTLPYNVGIYGSWRTEGISSGATLYDFRSIGDIYRASKIAIGDNQFPEATGFCSDRAFMILASGCLMMHQKVYEMETLLGLKDGVHYVSWTNYDDLREKVNYYMTHEEERARIAKAGQEEFLKNHTYVARVQELWELFKGIRKQAHKVSALVICKNEEMTIARCLDQLEWADEIVVVDTGSTDATLEVLGVRQMDTAHPDGAEVVDPTLLYRDGKLSVYQTKWVGDFSVARNFAKSKCTGDWIFWMDADETLPQDTQEQLAKVSEWNFRRFGVAKAHAVKMTCIDTATGRRALQTRLFRNIPKVEWRMPVHETVDDSVRELGLTTVGFTNLTIHHLGSNSKERIERSQRRNLEILKTMPAGIWKDMQIGSSFAAMGRFGDAIVYYSEAIRTCEAGELKDFLYFSLGFAYAGMGLTKHAIAAFEKSSFPDAIYHRADLKEAIQGVFSAEDYRKVVEAEMPTDFPSQLADLRPIAKEALRQWHTKELEKLA